MKLFRVIRSLAHALEEVVTDVQELPSAFLERDPAARSRWEVILLYPGFKAIVTHRIGHALWKGECHFLARSLSELGRFTTGIEIHPGAQLGRRVVIDHGMGTVIGETAVVKDDCLIYHGVTLGGIHKTSQKRHPTIEANSVIGAGASVLGDINVGPNAKVGSGAVVLKPVPPDASVGGITAEIFSRKQRFQSIKN